MYETPKLFEVGRAEDVILGLTDSGSDIDLLFILPDLEFAEDE